MFASEPFLIYTISGKAAVSWCLAKVGHSFFVYCVGKGRGLEKGVGKKLGKAGLAVQGSRGKYHTSLHME